MAKRADFAVVLRYAYVFRCSRLPRRFVRPTIRPFVAARALRRRPARFGACLKTGMDLEMKFATAAACTALARSVRVFLQTNSRPSLTVYFSFRSFLCLYCLPSPNCPQCIRIHHPMIVIQTTSSTTPKQLQQIYCHKLLYVIQISRSPIKIPTLSFAIRILTKEKLGIKKLSSC